MSMLSMFNEKEQISIQYRARGATLKVGGLTSDPKWGGGGG